MGRERKGREIVGFISWFGGGGDIACMGPGRLISFDKAVCSVVGLRLICRLFGFLMYIFGLLVILHFKL